MGTILTIPFHEDVIREMAFRISQQPKSWDDFIWLLAEAELRISKSYTSQMNSQYGQIPSSVTIDNSQVIDQPARSEIIQLAQIIAARSPSLQELHWNLAERQYIYDQAKKAAKNK